MMFYVCMCVHHVCVCVCVCVLEIDFVWLDGALLCAGCKCLLLLLCVLWVVHDGRGDGTQKMACGVGAACCVRFAFLRCVALRKS